MVFTAKIPELSDLLRIARGVKDYPCSTSEIVKVAKNFGFDKNVIDFLELFSHDRKDEFLSRSDFYTRAAELATLISEERAASKETFLNSQD